jgi:hypothetical protein
VVDPTFFGNTLIEIMKNPTQSKSPTPDVGLHKKIENVPETEMCDCARNPEELIVLPHFPDLKLCMGGFQQSLPFLTATDWRESAIDTCTRPDVSDRGPPPKRVTKTMSSCGTTTHRKNLKIFEHTLRGNSFASPHFE